MKKSVKIWGSVSILLLVLGSYVFFTSSMMKPNLDNKVKSKEQNTTEQLQVLQNLGFTNSDNLNLGETYDFVTNPTFVKYYNDKYGLQFLSVTGLEKFNKEYNIILGPTDKFIGHIPAANIVELNDNLKKMVSEPVPTLFYISGSVIRNPDVSIGYVPEDYITQDAIRQLLVSDLGVNFLSSLKPEYQFLYPADKYEYSGAFICIHISKKPETSTQKAELKVAAPDFDFNKTGAEVVNGELKNRKPIDPMVVMVVKDGYVVLTRWVE